MPVRDISMEACVELARTFGQELAEALSVPVYLYDRAALRPDRRSLADVRRGEYEGIKADLALGERIPDFGPQAIGKAGAVAVGARKPLVAFNVYLSGTDEPAAKEIARTVRESSGGLPAVRAIGFAVPERGCVTVSMNLVDFEVTGLRTAFDAVAAEARAHRMDVLDSEIVGLVPQAAIGNDDVAYLRMEGFDADAQILERLVSGDGVGRETVAGFLERLASDSATPGGGAAAAVAGATAAALIAMVGRLTVDKPGYEDAWERMRPTIEAADAARTELLELADRDAAAFDAVMAAFRMPRTTDAEKAARAAAVQTAFEGAASVPMEIATRAADLMDHVPETIELGNPNAASDGASAAQLLFAATGCAAANVEINAASLKDGTRAAELRAAARELRERARAVLDAANDAFDARLG
jgi:glutamate formiminotransferase/formiminotetrahydrofolate cyclodeaminase